MRNLRGNRLLSLGLALVVTIALTGCGGTQSKSAETKPAETTPATPAATAPVAAPVGPALIINDMVNGSANVNAADKAAGKSCVLTSRYLHNQQVVWRIKVLDPASGANLDDKAINKVTVTLNDGKKFEAKFGPHPKSTPTDSFWATSWTIPEEYPSGTVAYTITAEAKDGRKASQAVFNIAPSSLIVVDGKVPVIAGK